MAKEDEGDSAGLGVRRRYWKKDEKRRNTLGTRKQG